MESNRGQKREVFGVMLLRTRQPKTGAQRRPSRLLLQRSQMVPNSDKNDIILSERVYFVGLLSFTFRNVFQMVPRAISSYRRRRCKFAVE